MAAFACRKNIILFQQLITLSPLINNYNLKFNRLTRRGCVCIREITHLDSCRARGSAQHSVAHLWREIEHATNPPECWYFIWGDLFHALFHPSKTVILIQDIRALLFLFPYKDLVLLIWKKIFFSVFLGPYWDGWNARFSVYNVQLSVSFWG